MTITVCIEASTNKDGIAKSNYPVCSSEPNIHNSQSKLREKKTQLSFFVLLEPKTTLYTMCVKFEQWFQMENIILLIYFGLVFSPFKYSRAQYFRTGSSCSGALPRQPSSGQTLLYGLWHHPIIHLFREENFKMKGNKGHRHIVIHSLSFIMSN